MTICDIKYARGLYYLISKEAWYIEAGYTSDKVPSARCLGKCTDSLQWWFHLQIDGTSKGYITYSIAQGNNPSKMSKLFKPNQTQMTTIGLNSTILLKLSVNEYILNM
jgi:hypothetical protein